MRPLTLIVAVTAGFMSAPFLANAELPQSPPRPVVSACDRLGVVIGYDAFAQTFALKQDDGEVETVPFSKWTTFLKGRLEQRDRNLREIDSTEVQLGDRLCIVLDLSQATSDVVLVVVPARVASATAR